jgi:hypothetical protein
MIFITNKKNKEKKERKEDTVLFFVPKILKNILENRNAL